MVLLFNSPSIVIYYDDHWKVMKVVGTKESIHVPSEKGASAVIRLADEIRLHKPEYLLVNDKERTYIYAVEEQKWVAKVIASACAEVGAKKLAFINPKGYIQELSTIQTIEEAGKQPFELKYVATEEEAFNWFNTD